MSSSASKKNSAKKGPVRDIAVKNVKEEEGFTVHRIPSSDVPEVEPLVEDNGGDEFQEEPIDFFEPEAEEEEVSQPVYEEPQHEFAMKDARDFVKVKFSKFVQLVASHDLDEVLKNNEDEDVVLSSNLLTELAGAHDEERESRKTPIILLVGLAMGFVLAYILFNKW